MYVGFFLIIYGKHKTYRERRKYKIACFVNTIPGRCVRCVIYNMLIYYKHAGVTKSFIIPRPSYPYNMFAISSDICAQHEEIEASSDLYGRQRNFLGGCRQKDENNFSTSRVLPSHHPQILSSSRYNYYYYFTIYLYIYI